MAPNRSPMYTLTPSRRTYSRNTISSENGAQPEAPAPREFRRVIGYYNALCEAAPSDDVIAPVEPPTYEITLYRPARNLPRVSQREEEGREVLPDYTCTVSIEGALGMKLEQINPFEGAERPLWNDVYVTLTGPLLRVHALKKPQSVLGNKNLKTPQVCGRLLKAYTLQHAEVGIAADHPKVEMVPKSSFVHMLPEGAIERLQESEPQLFETVRRHVIRLRLEADQFLLRFDSSEDRARWLEKICAAVDIAPALDDRTEPKYHTLPRRRRRNNAAMRAALAQALAASLLDQEGGGTLSQTQSNDQGPGRLGEDQDAPVLNSTSVDPDMADIDTGFAITDMPEAPSEDRSIGLTNLLRIFSSGMAPPPSQANASANGAPLTATSSNTAQPSGTATVSAPMTCTRIPARIYPDPYPKWQPQFLIDPAQQIRYRRHCLPNLLYTSKRANDIIIKDGVRWKIDWNHDVLRAYPEIPPTYDEVVYDLVPQISNDETVAPRLDRQVTAATNDDDEESPARPRLLKRLSSLRRRSIDSNRSSIYDQFVSAGPMTPQTNKRYSMELARPATTSQRQSVEINRSAVPARARHSMEIRRPPTWDMPSSAATPSNVTSNNELSRAPTFETPAPIETAPSPTVAPGPLSLNPVSNPLASNPVIPRMWNTPPRQRPNSLYTMPSTRPASVAARPMSMDIARIDEVEEHDRAPSRLAQTTVFKPRPVTPVQAPTRVAVRAPSPVATPKKTSFARGLLRKIFSRKDKTVKSAINTPAAGPSRFVSQAPSRTTTARPSTDLPRTRGRVSMDIFKRRSRMSVEISRPIVQPSMQPSVRPSARASVRPSMDMRRPSFQEMEPESVETPEMSTSVSTEFPSSAFPWRSATRILDSRRGDETPRPSFQRTRSSNLTTPAASSRVSMDMSRPSFQHSPSSGLHGGSETPRSAFSRMTSSPLANAPLSARTSSDTVRTGTTVTANGSPRKARPNSGERKDGFWRRRLSRKIDDAVQNQSPQQVSADDVFSIVPASDSSDQTTTTIPVSPALQLQSQTQTPALPQTPLKTVSALPDVREEDTERHVSSVGEETTSEHNDHNDHNDHNASNNSTSDSSSSTETEGEVETSDADVDAIARRRTTTNSGAGAGQGLPQSMLYVRKIAVEDFATQAAGEENGIGLGIGVRGLPAIVEVI